MALHYLPSAKSRQIKSNNAGKILRARNISCILFFFSQTTWIELSAPRFTILIYIRLIFPRSLALIRERLTYDIISVE